MELLCEVLRDDHDASAFDSGRAALDQWLRASARASDARNLSRTYVWHSGDDAIVAYYTLMPHFIERESLTEKQAHGLPERIPCYLIARLALDRRLHGAGLGSQLLASALTRAAIGARDLGGRYVIVDAMDDTAASFYRHHGFETIASRPDRLVLPAKALEPFPHLGRDPTVDDTLAASTLGFARSSGRGAAGEMSRARILVSSVAVMGLAACSAGTSTSAVRATSRADEPLAHEPTTKADVASVQALASMSVLRDSLMARFPDVFAGMYNSGAMFHDAFTIVTTRPDAPAVKQYVAAWMDRLPAGAARPPVSYATAETPLRDLYTLRDRIWADLDVWQQRGVDIVTVGIDDLHDVVSVGLEAAADHAQARLAAEYGSDAIQVDVTPGIRLLPRPGPRRLG